MTHASSPTSNPSLSSASYAGVVMRDTPIIFAFEIMGDCAGKEIFSDHVVQAPGGVDFDFLQDVDRADASGDA